MNAIGTTGKPLKGGTILLLEDEAFIGMAIREFLIAAGAKDVLHAFTIDEANALIAENEFDAAILDVRLPGGTSCFDIAVDLAKREIAIVFHSGHVQVEFLEAFPNAVFCGKPASPAKLIAALTEAQGKLSAA